MAALGLTGVAASAATFTLKGYLNYEYYPGGDKAKVEAGTAGAPAATALTSGVSGADKSGYVTSLESATNFAENYVNRFTGVFIPPTTGNYVFFIASDDDSDLFLSTDNTPANKHLIAQEKGWSGVRVWNNVGDPNTGTTTAKRSDQSESSAWPGATGSGATISLTAGNNYYIEAVHHEGGGGDNVGVYYKLDTDPDPTDGDAVNMVGNVIGVELPSAPVAPNVSIATQPSNLTLYVNGPGSLSVGVNSDSPFPVTYQWQKAGVDVPGATQPTLTFKPVLDDAGTYTVKVTYLGANGTPQTITSSPATVAVQSLRARGGLFYEYFPGQGDRTVVEAGGISPSFAGTTIGSDKSGLVGKLESGTNFADTYVNRFSGWFVPPQDGDYVFFVASDDDGDLFLSTDDTVANKKLIAQESGWSAVRSYLTVGGGSTAGDKRSDQFAASEWPTPNVITLTKDNYYYIEYVHHEGGGGDNVAVTYKLASQNDPANGDAPRLTGSVIAVEAPPQTINITQQPTSASVYGGTPVTFNVATTTDGPLPVLYQWRKNGVNIPGATSTSYSFVTASPGDNNATFDVVLIAPGVTNTTTVATLTVKPGALSVAGKLKREYWPNKVRSDVEGGLAGAPATVAELSSFESFTNFADNYTERVSGFFTPATTGAYVFFLASDDDTDLFLSTDSTPAHKQLIAQELGWSGVRRWYTVGGPTDANNPDVAANAAKQKRSDQFTPDNGATTPFAAGISLTAGTAYYIEAVHHEGGGGDNLAVTFKLIDGTDPVEADGSQTPPVVGDPSALTGSVISYLTTPVTTASITTQPHDISSYEAQSVTFSVGVSTDSEVTPLYQWRKGGVAIPGATGPTYTIPFLATTDAGTYDVTVTTPNLSGASGSLTSSTATLNVFPAPLIRGLLKYDYFPGGTKAQLEAGSLTTPSTAGTVVGGTKSGYITTAETDWNFGANYANRISGFFIPPENGDYVFFVAGDDNTDLFLSTDDKPANKKLIAQETGWSAYRRWNTVGDATTGSVANKRSDQFPNSQWPGAAGAGATISLVKDTLYYIEADHEEGGGGDNLGVTYIKAGDADPLDGQSLGDPLLGNPFDASRLTGNVIGVKLVPPTLTTGPALTAAYATTNGVILTFSQPLDHATAIAANFSISATGKPAVTAGTPTAKEVLQGNNVVTVVTVPATGLQANTTYDVVVSNVKNTAGLAIAAGADSTVKVTTPLLSLDFNEADASLPDGFTTANNGVSAGNAGQGPGQVVDAAGPDGSGAFFLTEPNNGEQGALIIPDLVNGDPVTNLTATFKLFIGHGSGNPADGMTFSFGNNIDVATALTLPFEEGAGVISVDFDTYNNGATGPGGQNEGPAFDVKLNGHMIGFAPLPQAAIVNDQWVDVIFALNSDNSITAIYNGVTYFDHLSLNNPTDLIAGGTVASYAPISNGIILFGGRTGSEHSEQAIDNFTLSVNSQGGVTGTGTGTTPVASHITVSSSGGNLTITWDHPGKLQSNTVIGTTTGWTDVAGATTGTATVPIGTGNLFYRVVATP